jgi:hypothetical protein
MMVAASSWRKRVIVVPTSPKAPVDGSQLVRISSAASFKRDSRFIENNPTPQVMQSITAKQPSILARTLRMTNENIGDPRPICWASISANR